MTEIEKKAEEYAKKKFETIGNFLIPDDIAEIYKDGYEQGQKETTLRANEIIDRCNLDLDSLAKKCDELEKENEELKKHNEYLYKVNDEQMERILKLSDELKNEIDFNENSETVKKYKAQIEELKEKRIDKSCKCIELQAQIEKMKNMQNCKHNWETKGQCILNNGGYCICDKWELAK